MISMELKAKFRRASRCDDENAVARQIRLVFEETLKFCANNLTFRKDTDFGGPETVACQISKKQRNQRFFFDFLS